MGAVDASNYEIGGPGSSDEHQHVAEVAEAHIVHRGTVYLALQSRACDWKEGGHWTSYCSTAMHCMLKTGEEDWKAS